MLFLVDYIVMHKPFSYTRTDTCSCVTLLLVFFSSNVRGATQEGTAAFAIVCCHRSVKLDRQKKDYV